MRIIFSLVRVFLLLGLSLLPLACGPQEGAVHEHAGSGHEEEESPSGAAFKAGKGITLKAETSKILGLTIANVSEELLPEVVQLNVQIFAETHRLTDLNIDHAGCQFHGSGFLPSEQAVLVKPEQPVTFQTSRGEKLEGFVAAVHEPLAHGEIEVIVGVTTAGSQLKDGEFVNAAISVPRSKPVTVIPRSALLRTVMGTYVYTVNGDAYYRTAVKVGGAANEKIEITDGLYAGDQVVEKPVETLWLIELRATKGGGHSH